MLTIRPARTDDERALLPIQLVTWTSDVSPGPPPAPDVPFFRSGTSPQDVLVAEEDGIVRGYIQLDQPEPMPSHLHVLAVNGLAVDPSRQRAGIGRALLEAAVEEARARGARKLSLRVLAPNTRARHLYESCGFFVEGLLRQEFLLDGEYVDDVFMAYDLTAGAT